MKKNDDTYTLFSVQKYNIEQLTVLDLPALRKELSELGPSLLCTCITRRQDYKHIAGLFIFVLKIRNFIICHGI